METGFCGRNQNKLEINEHLDTSASEERQPSAAVNVRDAPSHTEPIQEDIKDEGMQEMSELLRHLK